MFFDLLFALGVLLYYVVLDALNLAVRAVLPVVFCFTFNTPGFVLVASGSLLFGVMETVTAILVFIAIATLARGSAADALLKLVSWFYFADGVMSLGSFALGMESLYPGPRSFVGTMLQIPFPFFMQNVVIDKDLVLRYSFFASATACFVTSRRLAGAELFAGSYVLTAIAVGLAAYGATPEVAWRAFSRLVKRVVQVLGAVATSVWLLLVKVWPKVRDFGLSVWNFMMYHPIAVFVQDWLIRPVWRTLSPLVVPALTVLLTVTLIQAVIVSGISNPVLAVCQLYCAAAAAVATVVLSMHAFSKLVRLASFDPLKPDWSAVVFVTISKVLSLPFVATRQIWHQLTQGRIARFIWTVCEATASFAARNPFVALVLVFFGNLFFLFLAYKTVVGTLVTSMSDFVWANFLSVLGFVSSQFGLLQSASLTESTGSVGAVFAIALSQTAVFFLVGRILSVTWPRSVVPEQAGVSEMAAQLAEGMHDPRQCGRCGFGPVDYTGCAILTSHHGERRNGATVSNACPRCEWFVNQLNFWPYFSVERFNSEGANAAVRIRLFADVVLAVRAGAKALVVPFLVLRLVSFAPVLAGILALGYLAPWSIENWEAWQSLDNSYMFGGTRYPARNLGGDAVAGIRDDGDCGYRAPAVAEVTVAQAIEAIESAAPGKCFLEAGGACPLCLDDYSEEAVSAAAKGAQELRKLKPPVVALPCGHTLHYECAQQMIQSSQGSRQLRCPLCREPISMTGAVSGRLFN